MDKSSVLKIISAFRQAVEEQGIHVQKVLLFGSWVNGHPHEMSDIDLIVISEDFEGRDFWERIDILSRAIAEVFEPIEAMAMTQMEWDEKTYSIVEYAQQNEIVYAA
jgi:predicted nucleotidyltransferase